MQVACELVARYKSATDACTALVQEAAACWKRFEGSYRDDITAIVVFLPFLEGEGEDMTDKATPAQTTKARPPRCVQPRPDFLAPDSTSAATTPAATIPAEVLCLHTRSQQGAAPAEEESHTTYVNKGAVGLSRLDDIELSPPKEQADGEKAVAEGEAGTDDGNDFVQRRLSVHDVFDDKWNEAGGVDGWGEEEEAPVEPVG